MTWKPTTVPSVYRGLAKVLHSEKTGRFKIMFDEVRNADNEVTRPNFNVILPPESCPDNLVQGYFYVTMSGDKTELYRFHPATGSFKARFKEFYAEEGKKPAPKTYTNTFKGKEIVQDKFLAFIEIAEGKLEGIEVPYSGHYNITKGMVNPEINKPEMAYSKDLSRSHHTARLHAFLNAIGLFGQEPIPYRDNMLPLIQKVALQKKKVFTVIIDNGFVENFIVEGADEGDEDLPAWEDEGEKEEPVEEAETSEDFSDEEEKDDTVTDDDWVD